MSNGLFWEYKVLKMKGNKTKDLEKIEEQLNEYYGMSKWEVVSAHWTKSSVLMLMKRPANC